MFRKFRLILAALLIACSLFPAWAETADVPAERPAAAECVSAAELSEHPADYEEKWVSTSFRLDETDAETGALRGVCTDAALRGFDIEPEEGTDFAGIEPGSLVVVECYVCPGPYDEGENIRLAGCRVLAPLDENGTPAGRIDFVCNTNTDKFHYPDCASVDQMKEKNKHFFTGPRDELIEEGYVPCKNCNP